MIILLLMFLWFETAFAQDITRIHGYASRTQSGYTNDDFDEEFAEKSVKIYKLINKGGESVNIEETQGENTADSTQPQYIPRIQGSLNQFYQTNGRANEQLWQNQSLNQQPLTSGNSVNLLQDNQTPKPLKNYISFNIGRPFVSNMDLTQDSTTQSFKGQNEIYQGTVGFYFGKLFDVLPFMRFEYGAQYEVLSFTEETATQFNSIRNHNGTASVRTFVDIPLFSNLALSLGAEGGIGLFQQFYNTTTMRTFGVSYSLLSGFTFILSRTKSFYVLGKYGVIPQEKLSFPSGYDKNASLNSIGILVGMQFFL